MAPPDIDLVEMANPAIARGDGDIFELYVHVVLGYNIDTEFVSMESNTLYQLRRISDVKLLGVEGTFDQFAPVHLARCDLKRYYMVLYDIYISISGIGWNGGWFMVFCPIPELRSAALLGSRWC